MSSNNNNRHSTPPQQRRQESPSGMTTTTNNNNKRAVGFEQQQQQAPSNNNQGNNNNNNNKRPTFPSPSSYSKYPPPQQQVDHRQAYSEEELEENDDLKPIPTSKYHHQHRGSSQSDNGEVMSHSTHESEGDDDQSGFGNGTVHTDDEDGEHSGEHTFNSHSSGSSLTSKSLKSTLPCGMSMPVLMTIVIMVPIIFLVVVTAIPLNEAVVSQRFLTNHQDLFSNIKAVSDSQVVERLASSRLLFYPPTHPLYAVALEAQATSRAALDAAAEKLSGILQASDVQGQHDVVSIFMQALRDISVQREKVDSRTAVGPYYRKAQSDILDDIQRVLLYFSQGLDESCETLAAYRVCHFLVKRVTNKHNCKH
jgi:hypothetical protein